MKSNYKKEVLPKHPTPLLEKRKRKANKQKQKRIQQCFRFDPKKKIEAVAISLPLDAMVHGAIRNSGVQGNTVLQLC